MERGFAGSRHHLILLSAEVLFEEGVISRLEVVAEIEMYGEYFTLLHEGANTEPEAVEKREVVLHNIRTWVTWVGVIPLIGAESTAKEHASIIPVQQSIY